MLFKDEDRVSLIRALFLERYKGSKTELKYSSMYELLVAVVLSAQCTDKRVNMVTPSFFEKYPTVKDLSLAKLDELSHIIRSISFFNAKAKNLIKMAERVELVFGGDIPKNQSDLMSLAGIGRKSANVILGEYLGLNFMAVDTHVFRVSHRLGLSCAKSAVQTEHDLSSLFKDDLNDLHHAFVLFGRYVCRAARPLCENCFVSEFCGTKKNFKPR